MFKHLTSSDAVYQAHLIYELQKEFPGVTFTKSENGHSFDISGIPAELVNGWSSRRNMMLEKAEQTGVEVDDVGGMDRVFYQTRQQKETMFEDPHTGWSDYATELHGFGSEQADVLLKAKAIDKQVITEAEIAHEISLAVEKIQQTESVISENTLHRAVAEACLGKLNADQISDVMQQIKHGEIILDQQDLIIKLGEIDGMQMFSTVSMQSTERRLSELSDELSHDKKHELPPELIEKAIQSIDKILSDEQANLVRHLCKPGSLKIGEGAAGSGKSTSTEAAANAFKMAGYKVTGLASSWNAANILAADAKIDSRAIAGFINDIQKGKLEIGSKDVLIIDEAGLNGAVEAEKLVSLSKKAGAKIIFVGEEQQLNSVSAGPAMAIMMEKAGAETIETVRRQKSEGDRQMVADFRDGKSDLALDFLESSSRLKFHENPNSAKRALIKDWDDFTRKNPTKTTLILAVKNAEVRDLNVQVRQVLRKRGTITGQDVAIDTPGSNKSKYKANFAIGDQIVLKKNDDDLGVKNKDKAEIVDIRLTANSGHLITVKLDSGREIEIDTNKYIDKESGATAITHGYASTQWSSQGSTVDQSFVVAEGMDRRYAYVGMSRHREAANLYVNEGVIKGKLKEAEKPYDRHHIKIELAKQLNRKTEKLSTLDFDDDRLKLRSQKTKSDLAEMLERIKNKDVSDSLAEISKQAEQAAEHMRENKSQLTMIG